MENTSHLRHGSTKHIVIGTTEAHFRIDYTLYLTSSSRFYRIHAIDSIHVVFHVLWHPRYRLDPHRPDLMASTLSTRSTSSPMSYRIHAIDSIHVVVQVLWHPRYRLDPHRLPCRLPDLMASTLSTRSMSSSRSYGILAINSIHTLGGFSSHRLPFSTISRQQHPRV